MEAKASSLATALWLVVLFLLPIASNMLITSETGEQHDLTLVGPSHLEAQGRAQTTWSGTQTLSGTYTIGVADEVIIQPCTVVQLEANERIIVDGRLTVQGTASCPVVIEASGLGDHEGIQFNTSSVSRGSVIQNLTIKVRFTA